MERGCKGSKSINWWSNSTQAQAEAQARPKNECSLHSSRDGLSPLRRTTAYVGLVHLAHQESGEFYKSIEGVGFEKSLALSRSGLLFFLFGTWLLLQHFHPHHMPSRFGAALQGDGFVTPHPSRTKDGGCRPRAWINRHLRLRSPLQQMSPWHLCGSVVTPSKTRHCCARAHTRQTPRRALGPSPALFLFLRKSVAPSSGSRRMRLY